MVRRSRKGGLHPTAVAVEAGRIEVRHIAVEEVRHIGWREVRRTTAGRRGVVDRVDLGERPRMAVEVRRMAGCTWLGGVGWGGVGWAGMCSTCHWWVLLLWLYT